MMNVLTSLKWNTEAHIHSAVIFYSSPFIVPKVYVLLQPWSKYTPCIVVSGH